MHLKLTAIFIIMVLAFATGGYYCLFHKLNLQLERCKKWKKLLGIKGYYTSLKETEADNKIIIERYHELYIIEQAFRISKSDLQTRLIFHFKEQSIKLHYINHIPRDAMFIEQYTAGVCDPEGVVSSAIIIISISIWTLSVQGL